MLKKIQSPIPPAKLWCDINICMKWHSRISVFKVSSSMSTDRWMDYENSEVLFCLKKKKILPFVTTWMNLEDIMLSEIPIHRKTNTALFHLSEVYKLVRLTEAEIRVVVARCSEKEMATHSSILAWRIPWTDEPGGLPSVGSHRVGHDWNDLAAAVARC